MSNAADGYLGDWAPHKATCKCDDCKADRLQEANKTLHTEIVRMKDINKTLLDAVTKVWKVASGETQVAMDDTQGMEWIADYLSSLEVEGIVANEEPKA